MKKPRQTTRQKKSDRILHGSQSKDAIICDYALAPVDRMALQMDQKWGIDMLPELVSVETAQKYGSAVAKMNAAVEASDVEECRTRCEVVMRGMMAMDAEATSKGCQRASEDVWEVELNGSVYGIMKDGRSWPAIKEKRPELQLVTLREVAVALEYMSNAVVGHMIDETKKHFPDAEVVGIAKPKQYDDEIPF